MFELNGGSARLVAALASWGEDPEALQALAQVLRYMPEQLQQDIQALNAFHTLYDLWSNDACMGYAAAAAQAAGICGKQRSRLLGALEAAFEEMSVEDAVDFYESGEF